MAAAYHGAEAMLGSTRRSLHMVADFADSRAESAISSPSPIESLRNRLIKTDGESRRKWSGIVHDIPGENAVAKPDSANLKSMYFSTISQV